MRPIPTATAFPSVTCPACHCTGPASITSVPDYEYCLPAVGHYAECRTCGTLFQSPMPGFDQLGGYYPADYHAATSRGVISRLRHAGRLRQLNPLLHGEGALLDYGCGNGAFLLWAATQGLNRPLFGYEISSTNSIEHMADGAVTIVRGQPEHLLTVLPPCRLISLNHVIEHLPDPGATLSSLVPFLLSGGHIQGQTPAADSLERRIFGSRWSGYHSPRHTVVFSRDGMRRLLVRNGLEAPSVSTAFNPAAIAVSLAATVRGPKRGIRRKGPLWLGWLAGATLFAPIDLLAGGGIIDFQATKPSAP